MGSFDDHPKGESPTLDWVRGNVWRNNAAVERRAAAAPLWRKLLAFVGVRGPFDAWQMRTPIWEFYPPKLKPPTSGCAHGATTGSPCSAPATASNGPSLTRIGITIGAHGP